jgi:hypothetical protein
VSEFLTLDGVMQAPGAPDEDRSGGVEHGGWQLQFFDDAFGARPRTSRVDRYCSDAIWRNVAESERSRWRIRRPADAQ